MGYIYDMGDEWVVRIEYLEEIQVANSTQAGVPKVVLAERAGPPDDVGVNYKNN